MVERAQSTSTQLKYPRVLLIVPELGLPLSPETDAFYPLGYSVLTLQNVVTRERIFKAIEKREFEIIHYAGHSDGEGIELSGGVKMDAPALVRLRARSKLIWSFSTAAPISRSVKHWLMSTCHS